MLDREAFRRALLNLIINAKQAMPRRRAIDRADRGPGRHGGDLPDRHRLRDGRPHGIEDVRGVLSRRSRAARGWVCRRRKRSSAATAAGSACRASSAAGRSLRSSCRCRRGSRGNDPRIAGELLAPFSRSVREAVSSGHAAEAFDPAATAGPPIKVLVIDNDPAHAEAMAESLRSVGFECTVATSGREGVALLDVGTFEIVITDLKMPEIGGLEVLAKCKEVQPDAEVILVTGHGTIESAVEAMQRGAFNYLLKPLDLKQLRAVVENAARSQYLRRANAELHRRLDERFGFEGVIGNSPQMHRRGEPAAADRADGRDGVDPRRHGHWQGAGRQGDPSEQPAEEAAVRAAQLCGAERAHSRERAVRAHSRCVHRCLGRSAGKIRVRQRRHAVSGRSRRHADCRRRSNCLRVLESGEITRVGSNEPVHVDVRILSATNRDLEKAIAAGTFREDLYHRLKVVTIRLPRLAERREDIPLLDRLSL